jgi:hypothetical protein
MIPPVPAHVKTAMASSKTELPVIDDQDIYLGG